MNDLPLNDSPPDVAELSDDQFYERLQSFVGMETGPPVDGPDEVNTPMVRHLVEALGDRNPVYVDAEAAAGSVHGGLVAPPTMLQAWVMTGIEGPKRGGDGPYEQMNELLFGRGFTSVVATNCEQTYHRYLRPGERVSMRTVIDSISPQKTTGLGTGHFVTTRQDYFAAGEGAAGDAVDHGAADDELVGSMLFRIIRFRPATKAPRPQVRPPRPAPATTPDNSFWFDALAEGRLVIQRCAGCGELRHPPGPMCPRCHALEWDTVPAAGHGTIHSFVVVHYPVVPSFEYPLPVALVDVNGAESDGVSNTNGRVNTVRMVMNVVDEHGSQVTEGLAIGQRVQVEVRPADSAGTLLPFAVVTGGSR